MELALKVYSNETSISLKKCNSFFNHILKLSKMSIDYMETDENGIPFTGGMREFFTLKNYYISDSFSSSSKVSTLKAVQKEIDITGEGGLINTGSLTKDHFNHMILQLEPGDYLRSQYISHRTSAISTVIYQSLPSPKSKVLVKLFIEDRFRNMPSLNSRLTMLFIRTQVRVASGEITRLKKDIKDTLEYLKSNNMIIADYVENRNSFDITYLSFSEHEKMIYDYQEYKLISSIDE